MITHPNPAANVQLINNSTDDTVIALQGEIESGGLALDGVRFWGVQVEGAGGGRGLVQAYLADDATGAELAICTDVFAAHA